MKHPYSILIKNLDKYSKTLKKDDVKQYAENAFEITDIHFDKLKFFNDVEKEINVKVKKHKYLTSSCADVKKCFKPYDVYGFDNVLFYFKNENF